MGVGEQGSGERWWKRSSVRFDYRPELDGVRAFAVLAVLLLHSHPFLPGPFKFRGGFLGVDVFFVLSGYLITTLLYREFEQRDEIRLGGFYARRALRLIPALFVMLAVGAVVVYYLGGNPGTGSRSYLQSALLTLSYVANWFQAQDGLGVLSHTWSLAIEEQYYVIWPAVLILGIRFVRSPRRMAAVLLGIAVGIAVLRYAVYEAGYPAYAALSTFTRTDGVIIGSALALLLVDPPDWARNVFKRTVTGVVGAAVVVGIALVVQWNSPGLMRGGLFAANVGTAILLGHLAIGGASAPKRILSIQPLPIIGRISYGMYLFHVPINYVVHSPRLGLDGGPAVALMFVATFVFAGVSFLAIERPALRLKRRFGSISEDDPAHYRRLVAAG
jgi:peptidoglycan/LPS O-acetylase OafA/YrhL